MSDGNDDELAHLQRRYYEAEQVREADREMHHLINDLFDNAKKRYWFNFMKILTELNVAALKRLRADLNSREDA